MSNFSFTANSIEELKTAAEFMDDDDLMTITGTNLKQHLPELLKVFDLMI
jgi:hypothetical protein